MAEKQSRKPKAKQPLTIQDQDLNTPLHDEILLWLDAHVADLLGTIKGHRHEIAVHYHGLEVGQTVTTQVRFEVVKKDWQKPIVVDRSIAGFVDLLVEFRAFPGAWEAFVFDDRYKRPEIDLAQCQPQDEVHFLHPVVGFEVKASIASLGATIRQLRTLQVKLKGIPFCIVSPDDRFAKILEEQGIGFIQYTGRQP